MSKKTESKVDNPLKGIVLVTGERGTGKTSLALGHPVSSPKELGILNFDGKEYPQLGWGFYRTYLHMLTDVEKKANAERDMTEKVLADIKTIPDHVRILIVDAGEVLKGGLNDWTMRQAGKLKSWSGGGTMLVISKKSYAKTVEASMLVNLLETTSIETIYVINHVKDEWENIEGSDKGVKTGLRIPNSSDVMAQKAVAQFWTEVNPNHSCPIVAVLKSPGMAAFENGRVMSKPMLPPRLDPVVLGDKAKTNHVAVWDIIHHYIDNGGAPVEPRQFEQPTAEQVAYMKGVMTPAQQRAWELRVKMALAGKLEEDNEELFEAAKAVKESGKPLPMAVAELKKQGFEVTIGELSEIYEAL